MSDKFIPNGDFDFVMMAEHFARTIAAKPARFGITQSDAEELSAAVVKYRQALTSARGNGASRSAAATAAKEEAREQAERIVRRLAHLIRANDSIDAASKVLLGMRPRPAKAKQQTCPPEPPRLRFVRALHESGTTPMHELEFCDYDRRSTKPAGAVRLELFIDLIPPEEPIPAHPGANHSGRPWYLRSFTRSPIIIAPPLTRVPMRVVYWGRWSDSTGNVGPFSATAVAWIEGGSAHFLPGGMELAFSGRKPATVMLEDATPTAPAGRDQRYSVAVVEAQYLSFQQTIVQSAPQLVASSEREPRQIEGPQGSDQERTSQAA